MGAGSETHVNLLVSLVALLPSSTGRQRQQQHQPERRWNGFGHACRMPSSQVERLKPHQRAWKQP